MGIYRNITLLVIFLQSLVFADSTVLRVDASYKYVTISQNYLDPWGMEDEVCITRSNSDVACGLIKFSDPETAIVKISRYSPKVEKKEEVNLDKTLIELQMSLDRPEENDGVRLVTKNPKVGIKKALREIATSNPFNSRTISFSEQKVEVDEKTKLEEMRKLKTKIYWDDNVNPVSAISIGLDYAWPFIEYTQSITANVAMTLRAVKLNYPVGGGFIDGLGGYLTYNYYPFRPLRGMWFQSGVGFYSLKVDRNKVYSSGWSPALISTIGYKVVWKDTLSFGFAGGLEYLPMASSGGVTLDFSGFLPSCLLSVGYFF